MGGVDIELTGEYSQVIRMLRRLDTAFSAEGMTRFMNTTVTPMLQERAEARFDMQGDGASGKWLPLAVATTEIRQAGIDSGHFAGITATHPINVRTGSMEEYITNGPGDITVEGAGSVALHFPNRVIPNRKALNTKVRRAQMGDGRTPRRPVLAVNEKDLSFFSIGLAKYIQGHMQ